MNAFALARLVESEARAAHAFRRTMHLSFATIGLCDRCGAVIGIGGEGVSYVYPHPEGTRTTTKCPPCVPAGWKR